MLRIALAFALTLGAFGCKRSAAATSSEGADLFANACARCHGADGSGGLPLFEGGPSPRDLRDPAFQRSHGDPQIRMTIVNGKGSGMPPFGATFTDAQLDALVAHVRALEAEKTK
ncbi:MAG: c-type cytochrome [Labilithrix sp.]|nr:c-type cytochrome [Labilithrix sp.]